MSDNGRETEAARPPDLEQWPSTGGPVTVQQKIELVLSNGAPWDMQHLIEATAIDGSSAYKNVHRGVTALIKKGLISPSPHPKDNKKKVYTWSYFVDHDERTPELPHWLTLDWGQSFYPEHDIGWRSKDYFGWYRILPNWTLRIAKPKLDIGAITDDELTMYLQDACEHTGDQTVQFNATPMSNKPKTLSGFEILGFVLSRGMDHPNLRSITGRWLGQTRDRNPTLIWPAEGIIWTERDGATLHPSIARTLANVGMIPSLIPKGEAWDPGNDVVRQITKKASSVYRDMSYVPF